MEDFIQFHYEQAIAGAPYEGIMNCHVPGLHSLVLQKSPHGMIRVYFADENHTLHMNDPEPSATYSLAIHGHRQNLTLIGLLGRARNDQFALVPDPKGKWHEHDYTSAIIDGKPSMTPTGRRAAMYFHSQRFMTREERIKLSYRDLHSVYVPEGERAAWMVIEGPPELDASQPCWRNTTDPVEYEGLYQPMTHGDVLNILEQIK